MSKLPEVKEAHRNLVLYWFKAWGENFHLTIYHYYDTYHFLTFSSKTVTYLTLTLTFTI